MKLSLAFPAFFSLALAVPLNDTVEIFSNGVSQGPGNTNGVTFPTLDSMLKSTFWKSILAKKDPERAKTTVVHVQDTKSVYHFGDSECDGTIKRKSTSGWWFSTPQVEMKEVRYGDPQPLSLEDVPISACSSSKLSSSGGSYTYSTTISNALSLVISAGSSPTLAGFGLGLSAGIDDISFTHENTGSITCTIGAGKTVQVFGSQEYSCFPEARVREVVLAGNSKEVVRGKWEKLQQDQPKPVQQKSQGAVVFARVQQVPSHYCVDDPAKLQCNLEEYNQEDKHEEECEDGTEEPQEVEEIEEEQEHDCGEGDDQEQEDQHS